MKYILIICLIVVSMAVSAQEIGYLVCTSGVGGNKFHKTQSIESVQKLIELKFPDVEINVEKQLKFSNYVQILTENSGLYIEKKHVVRKKNGKLKYKRIKK